MATDFVPTRIVFYGCRAWEPKFDAAYRPLGDAGLFVPRRRSRKSRPPADCICGHGPGSIFRKDRPLALCEACMRHTLELRIAAPPPEKRKPAPAFRPKLSNREKRRLRLAGRSP